MLGVCSQGFLGQQLDPVLQLNVLGLEQSRWVPLVGLSLFVVSVLQFGAYCSSFSVVGIG